VNPACPRPPWRGDIEGATLQLSLNRAEALGELGPVLQRPDPTFREGVVGGFLLSSRPPALRDGRTGGRE
jgi:hypothetical protein